MATDSKQLALFARMLACLILFTGRVFAEGPTNPEIGYVFPPAGRAGETIDVQVGVYEWTPDLQYVVHTDHGTKPAVEIKPQGPAGPLLLQETPHAVGKKGYHPRPLPREVPARITIPAGAAPGLVRWRVANANGPSRAASFIISNERELREEETRDGPQEIGSLPAVISGRVRRHEECDRYWVRRPTAGTVTCALFTHQIGSPLRGVVEVRDARDRLIADAVDTQGADVECTFFAEAGEEYAVTVRELEFLGHRSFVYRLAICPEPRVVAPRGGQPVGRVGVPARFTAEFAPQQRLQRYEFAARKGERLAIHAESRVAGPPVDLSLAVIGPDGKVLGKNDDLPGTTDAGVEFVPVVDGVHVAAVGDLSDGGLLPHVYRFSIEPAQPDFAVEFPQSLTVVPGERAELPIAVHRRGSFEGPVRFSLSGLGAGLRVSTDPNVLVAPAGKGECKLSLAVDKDCPVTASLLRVEATAEIGGRPVTRAATAPHASGDDTTAARLSECLVAVTLKPRVRIWPVESDERTVHRGTVHLAEIGIERLEGFEGEVLLQLESRQPQKFRQGVTGPDIIIPPGQTRVLYPCFVGEHLETVDAYRVSVNAYARVRDGRDREHWLVSAMPSGVSVAITVEGGLMKLTSDVDCIQAKPGTTVHVPVRLVRSPKLKEPATISVVVPPTLAQYISSAPVNSPPDLESATLELRIADRAPSVGRHELTLKALIRQPATLPRQSGASRATPMSRATRDLLNDGVVPVVSETVVPLEITPQ